jgi:hypothetical protein
MHTFVVRVVIALLTIGVDYTDAAQIPKQSKSSAIAICIQGYQYHVMTRLQHSSDGTWSTDHACDINNTLRILHLTRWLVDPTRLSGYH